MSNFSALKTAIQNAIKQNGNEEITGNLLQGILLSIVETLGDSAINILETDLSNEATTRGNADTQLNNLITGVKNNVDNGYVYAGIATPSTTPVSGKVFYIALQAGTYINFGSQVVLGGITILKYNGSAWSKEQVLYTDGGVFDISAYNATDGELAKYANLTAALGTSGANIPQSIRKGGMSVKFVQTDDNKYVQYRLISTTFKTNVKLWQGVDDEPADGSDNLVKSGGVYNDTHHFENIPLTVKTNNYNIGSDGSRVSLSPDYRISDCSVSEGEKYQIIASNVNTGPTLKRAYAFYSSTSIDSNSFISGGEASGAAYDINIVVTVPQNAVMMCISEFKSTPATVNKIYDINDIFEDVEELLDKTSTIDDAPTPNSNNLVKSGGVLNDIMTNGSAFDYSAYRNGQTFTDLQSALNSMVYSAPDVYKKGGMSLKFIRTSDNKYVQYRLTNATFSSDANKWQGVDEEPTVGSSNLVASDGIYQSLGFNDIELSPKKLGVTTWSGNATITDLNSNIMGVLEPITKIDFNINDTTKNTFGLNFKENSVQIHENDILNFVVCIYTEENIDKLYTFVKFSIGFNGSFTELTPRVLHIRKGFNYFFYSVRCNFTQLLTTNCFYQLYIQDNSLDGLTWYYKGYWYIGTPGRKVFSTELKELVNDFYNSNKQIVCWGDSLTAGAGASDTTNAAQVKSVLESKGYILSASTYNYPTLLQTLLGDKYAVVNCGVGGENIYAISARQGGNNAMLAEQVTLPSNMSTVNINIPISSFDREGLTRVLLQGGNDTVNPCFVQGIECTLSVTYDEGFTNIQYKLKRNTAGDRNVVLPQYTPIIMQGNKLNQNTGISILWCWQNGGYSSDENLVEKLKNMISHLKTTKYIVIGLHTGNLSSRNSQESLLEKNFGDKFFNWRQYASSNALYDFGITPNTDDISAMQTGSMPPSLLHDTIHLNSAGYMILGYKIFERMQNLGYIA